MIKNPKCQIPNKDGINCDKPAIVILRFPFRDYLACQDHSEVSNKEDIQIIPISSH